MLEIYRTLFSPPRHLILLLVAAWLGSLLSEKRALRHRLSKDALSNLVFYGLVAFILGGRVFYAVAHFPAFIASPVSLFSLNTDLFDPLGAALSALLAGWTYARRRKLPPWNTLDGLVPFFALLAIGLGLSHLASGAAFGQPTGVPWGINLWNAHRHPSQVYETLAAFVVYSLIWFRRQPSRPGLLFLSFVSMAAASRLFLEAYRGDSSLLFGGFRLAQGIALLVLAGSFILIELRLRTPVQAQPSLLGDLHH
jgi:phosphatidylglycerol:prolipoprotein diacylglycerol transferase